MTALTVPRRWPRVVLALMFAFGLSLPPVDGGADAPVAPATVKAAYLQKFPGFVDWPPDAFASAGAPFVIGVAGAEAVLSELLAAARAGRRIQGRALEVHPVSPGALPHVLHLLYVGREAAGEAPALLADARATHALLVTDLPEGLQLGAALNFVESDGRVRFEAAPGAARRADLRLGSALLSVATRVVEEAP